MNLPPPAARLSHRHAELYLQHKDAVWNAAWHLLGERAAAEDVLQDVFVALVRQHELPRQPRAWLLQAVLNRVRDLARRQRRLASAVDSADAAVEALPGIGAEPPHTLLARERSEQVAQALAALPLDQREAVVLHMFEGLSFRAVGELCGVSLDTAASRWRYACDKLRQRLRATGVQQE